MGTCGWAANFVLASASNSFELLFSAQGKADFRRSLFVLCVAGCRFGFL